MCICVREGEGTCKSVNLYSVKSTYKLIAISEVCAEGSDTAYTYNSNMHPAQSLLNSVAGRTYLTPRGNKLVIRGTHRKVV